MSIQIEPSPDTGVIAKSGKPIFKSDDPAEPEKEETMKVFPVSFTEPPDRRIVVMEQVHHKQLSDKVKQLSVSLTIETEADHVVISILATNGAKNVDSQFTLSLADTRQFIHFLDRAVKDVEQYIEYGTPNEK